MRSIFIAAVLAAMSLNAAAAEPAKKAPIATPAVTKADAGKPAAEKKKKDAEKAEAKAKAAEAKKKPVKK